MQWPNLNIPLILWGKGVVRGRVSTYPAVLADLAPTTLTLLGIRPYASDGVLLADALYFPPSGTRRLQADREQSLGPLTDALSRRLRTRS